MLLLEELSCVTEVNYRDPFALAVVRSGVVGHIPRKISSMCSMFETKNYQGGTISCRITGSCRQSLKQPRYQGMLFEVYILRTSQIPQE